MAKAVGVILKSGILPLALSKMMLSIFMNFLWSSGQGDDLRALRDD